MPFDNTEKNCWEHFFDKNWEFKCERMKIKDFLKKYYENWN
jgi:hypothetical protein